MYYQHKLLPLIAVFISSIAFSQKNYLGVTAGIALANMKSYVDNKETNLETKTGFTVGVMARLHVSPGLSIQPALNYVQKGADENEDGITSILALNYLELPVNLVYTSQKNHGLFIGGGPAISSGLSGKFKLKSSSSSASEDVKFGSKEEDNYERMEISVNVLAGYKLPAGLLFAINYNHGFSNLFHSNEDGELKNKYFGIRVGYLFAAKK